MQIKINLQIFIFIIIFIITNQIQIYGLLMLFGLIHELAHMLIGILLKLKPKTLEVMPFGLSIVFNTYGSRKMAEVKKIIIAIAGPASNFIIAVLAYLLPIAEETQYLIIYSNLIIVCFNLFPIYPLDGGRILKSIIRLKYDFYKTEQIVNTFSNAFTIILTFISSILILVTKNIAIFFVIIYLWVIVMKENKKYSLKKKICQCFLISSPYK